MQADKGSVFDNFNSCLVNLIICNLLTKIEFYKSIKYKYPTSCTFNRLINTILILLYKASNIILYIRFGFKGTST